ncbi:hypothetical protein [Paludibaculum fermentans]|uniref:hypothetical protein n=1 Tax=Paludibaculum fermentans TaxID=1473598 RepID=UPI003EBEC8CF
MMVKLLLSFCLPLSLYAQCAAPANRLSTAFSCTVTAERLMAPVKVFLAERVKGGEIETEKSRVVAHNKAETVAVWLTEGKNGEIKVRVEVRPADSAPLLGESADSARALQRFLVRALQ